MRLGVYSDDVYHLDCETLTTDLPFLQFVAAIAPRVTEVVLFGRLDPSPARGPFTVSGERVRFVPLPHYPRLTAIREVVASLRRASRAFATEADSLDAVWLFGPHPVSLVFIAIALGKGKPVFLGVRQDFPRYIASRLPSRSWFWAIAVAHALERVFRVLARRLPTVVVGDELGRKYAGGGAPHLVTGFSLVREAEVVPTNEALERSWEGDVRVLNVGRLEPEKNPLLLPAVLARLRERDPRWRLVLAGDGTLAHAVERRAVELGVHDAMEFLGYVPFGPALAHEYRSSHAFLHVSLTEGLPQVLFEAHSAGLPVVATDVGGVRSALGDGKRGIVVPPNDAGAAARALERLARDAPLRRGLVIAGLEYARRETIEAQIDRLADFFGAQLRQGPERRGLYPPRRAT